MTHLGITIGPIDKTIAQARAIKEIWASSFIFSLMMKKILSILDNHPKVKCILNPMPPVEEELATFHGAGIYPDRCQVELNDNFTDEDIHYLVNEVMNSLPNGLGRLKNYFHIYSVQADFLNNSKDNIIHQLNKVMDDMELQKKYQAEGKINVVKILTKSIYELQDLGMAKDDKIFIHQNQKRRLPSIIEICTQELKNKDSKVYKNEITDRISENTFKYYATFKQEVVEEERMMQTLKSKLFENEFKLRHKYYAIVRSDGDGIGRAMTKIGNKSQDTIEFSKKLMDFSKMAAEKIADFGGLPVYIGGDDLLFFTPLVNEKGENLFSLIKNLDKSFERIDATMSYGIAITYYKHPMSNASNHSSSQLFNVAKQLKIGQKGEENFQEKNALAFLLRKHSGQHFGTVLPKEGKAFDKFVKMLSKYSELENTFLSATMYTLQQQEYLLLHALYNSQIDAFFKNNFNEHSHKINQNFLDDVKELAVNLAEDMKLVQPNKAWTSYLPPKVQYTPIIDLEKKMLKDKNRKMTKEEKKEIQEKWAKVIISNTLFSCLRLIQFLNANDHE